MLKPIKNFFPSSIPILIITNICGFSRHPLKIHQTDQSSYSLHIHRTIRLSNNINIHSTKEMKARKNLFYKKKTTHRFRSLDIRVGSRLRFDNNGMCCMAVSVVPRSLSMAHAEVGHDIGATSDETASNPRDSLSISAPNWCNAVMVDGVGSGILSNNINNLLNMIEVCLASFRFMIFA